MINAKDSIVIGSGYWGENIMKVLNKKKRLYGIIETNFNRAQIIKKKYNIKIIKFTDLKSPEIKNCFITTPSYLHYKHCLKVSKYSKNIFVEKPLAFDEKKIDAIEKKIKKTNTTFMVGYLLLHHPALIKLKEEINSKKKRVILIKSSRKGNGKIRPKDNVLWNLAVHDIAYLLDIFGSKITKISKLNFKFLDNKIDESKIYFNFKNNIKYSGEFSWLNVEKNQNLIIQTNNEIYKFDDLSDNKLIKFKYAMSIDNQKNKIMKIISKKIIKFKGISPLENEIDFFFNKTDKNLVFNNLKFTKTLTKVISKLSI